MPGLVCKQAGPELYAPPPLPPPLSPHEVLHTDLMDLSRGVLMQVALYEAATARYEQQLRDVNAEKSSLQSQLQAADMHIHSTDTQLQASRLNMRYLKVRQQLSQTAPTLSYVQAYEVSCGLGSE